MYAAVHHLSNATSLEQAVSLHRGRTSLRYVCGFFLRNNGSLAVENGLRRAGQMH